MIAKLFSTPDRESRMSASSQRTSRKSQKNQRSKWTFQLENLEARQMFSAAPPYASVDDPTDQPPALLANPASVNVPRAASAVTAAATGDAPSNRPGQLMPLDSNGRGALNGSIQFTGDRDMYKIVATKSGRMTVDLHARSNSLDPYLYVYDANGRQIAKNNNSGPGSDARVSMDVVAGRTYYLQAKAFNNNTVGSYKLSVSTAADAPGTRPGRLKRLNSDGSGSFSGSIQFRGDRDMYRFVATKSGRMTINLHDNSSLDPFVYVYDTNGRQITSNNNSGPGDDARASLDVAKGKTYYVLAKAFNDRTTGSYQLSFSTSTLR